MKKITLLLSMSFYMGITFACHTENIKTGTCVSPGNPVSVTGSRLDPVDWDNNVIQGWKRSYNNGVTWEDVPGSNSETYVIHSIPAGYSSVLYMYWAKELSNIPGGAVQNQVYLSGVPLLVAKCTTTPVNLLFFDGTKNNADVQLLWENGTETNVRSIEIQRSTDGAIFTTIASIAPKGENTLYQFTDPGALNGVKIMYYRLNVVDNNGSQKYSGTIKVSASGVGLPITIGPTLTRGILYIRTEGAYLNLQKTKIQITDMQGRILLEQAYSPQISLERLPSGYYLCKVIDPASASMFVGKICKQ